MRIDDFLLARIAEDEWVARPFRNDLGDVRPWRCDEIGGTVRNGPRPLGGPGDVAQASTHLAAEHIARHDPARVLAECAAKRAIVELHWTAIDQTGAVDGPPLCNECGGDYWPCQTLRLLALPFASHPDFDPAWADTPPQS